MTLMPFSISQRPDLHLVMVSFWGEVDDTGLTDYMDAICKLGPFNEPFDVLIVIDDEAQVRVATGTIRRSAHQAPIFHPGARRVIVAKQDVAFGLSRVYITESGGMDDSQVSHELHEAAEYLDHDVKSLESALTDMRVN